jgi:hypothetical protein
MKEEGSSATDFVADVADVTDRKKEEGRLINYQLISAIAVGCVAGEKSLNTNRESESDAPAVAVGCVA